MTRILIICPICSTKGFIEISDEALKNITRGLLAVNVAEKTICAHNFIFYVDRNLKIRDYFVADFQIELPVMDLSDNIDDVKIPSKEIINLDLIKLNLSPLLISYVLKAILSKKKITIISNEPYLNEHIINFFKYITKNTFIAEITIISDDDFNNHKKMYNDQIVLKGSQILRDKEKTLDIKKIGVEKQVVSNFFTNQDLSYSYIMFKNEIRKMFKLSQSIADFINTFEDKTKINSKNLLDYIYSTYQLKLHTNYLEKLIDIIKSYFEVEFPEIPDSADFLGFI